MKTSVYSLEGSKKKEVSLPAFFDDPVREDLVWRAVRVELDPQPYGVYTEAGKRHSASGIISHKRHDWKGQYGRGISRVPRKILWRRGTQFNWVGAEVSGTRGGRRPGAPKPYYADIKMNKKEMALALKSALAATAQESFITERYETLDKMPTTLPLVLEMNQKDRITAKAFTAFVEKVLGSASGLGIAHQSVRAGKGKSRGRRHKASAGILLITADGDPKVSKSFETRSVKELQVRDLYPLGRIIAFTEKALDEVQKL